MTKSILHILLIFILTSVTLKAQFVLVRDSNFVKALRKKYPNIMSTDSLSVDTTKAATVAGVVNFANSEINDAYELKYFKKVRELQLQNNNLKNLPDFSSLNLLNILDIRANPWNAVSQIDPLKSRANIILIRGKGGVKIKDFTFLNAYTKLTRIELSNCYAEILPDFSSYSGLTQVIVNNNLLTFKELSKLTSIPNYDTVVTAFPQMNLTPDTSIQLYVNKPFSLSVPIDTSVKTSTITYDFYKNGNLVQSSTSYQLVFNPFTATDTGRYYMLVRSAEPLFKGDSLVTGIFTLKKMPCPSLSNINYTTIESCEKIGFQINSIANQTNYPLSALNLVEKTKQNITPISLGKSTDFAAGQYNLYLKDTNQCETLVQNFVELTGSKDCNLFFSPNGDGSGDNYFLEGNGMVTIKNKTGQTIKQIQAPGYWDGTDKNGSPMEIGIYVIEYPTGERQKLSLLR